jgi:hypothetical protein
MDPAPTGNDLPRISGRILEDGMGRSSAPIATRHFRRVETKAEMTSEEQLAIREAVASLSSPISHDEFNFDSAPSPAKSAGFGRFHLRGMVERMFRGSGGAHAGSASGEQSASVTRGGGVSADEFPIGETRDEIISRNAMIRAEQLYDSIFVNLSRWLQRKRHKDLRAQLHSLEWLMSEGAIEFEEKASLMKVE